MKNKDFEKWFKNFFKNNPSVTPEDKILLKSGFEAGKKLMIDKINKIYNESGDCDFALWEAQRSLDFD